MKTVAVVATEKKYARFLRENTEKYLGRYAEFTDYSIREVEQKKGISEDFVLISAFNIFQQVRSLVTEHTEIIVLSLSLNKKQMEKLKSIPKGTRALLVNYDDRSCLHTITSMYDAGFRDVELYSYCGYEDYDHSIELAITPNEEQLVPPGIKHVINLGESSVDVRSLYEIADKLGVYDEFSTREAIEARKEYFYISASVDRLLGEKETMLSRMRALVKLMKEGIVVTDILGKIYLTNEKANQLMSFRTKVLEGFNIEDVLPEAGPGTEGEHIIQADRATLVTSSVPVKSGDEVTGYIITISDFEERERAQHVIRSQLAGGHHNARYHFSDIIGESRRMRQVVEQAERMVNSGSSVLITGESGTGKELFAQSIHNASYRRFRSFVAVNCAAIPDSLLESEMFGYEEGSFTGARKGGKAGYFEIAHGGTIFLDEIGEMPLQLQAKLLRVIEERRVIRVGSDKEIDIDVRIISATNRDLHEMVEEGTFREDLYYRLNVLPLNLPPLREHPEDIPELVEHYVRKFGGSFTFSDDAMSRLMGYGWKGNYRELRNVIEYLSNQRKDIIRREDLNMLRMESPKKALSWKNVENTALDTGIFEKFTINEGADLVLYREILRVLLDFCDQGIRPGRMPLGVELNTQGIPVTQGELRHYLRILTQYGFVKTGRGRAGSMITPDGEKVLRELTKIL
ncbi:sigma-54 interaction domain-containing protein [Hornefia butyriciproducens]|uniref:sigma-54 interaction domain-containing protein n=1 Tax=Hornefia butyriciproducens TaxID=2652293 RepID=UPI003F897CDC